MRWVSGAICMISRVTPGVITENGLTMICGALIEPWIANVIANTPSPRGPVSRGPNSGKPRNMVLTPASGVNVPPTLRLCERKSILPRMLALSTGPSRRASLSRNWPCPTEKGTRRVSNGNCSRTMPRFPSRADRPHGTVRPLHQQILANGVTEQHEILGPQRAGALSHAGAIEIDLEVHGTADRAGIKADELEQLSCVGGVGPQQPLLSGLGTQHGGERFVAVQDAAHIERGQLVVSLLQRDLDVAQSAVVVADHGIDFGPQIQARPATVIALSEAGDIEE